MASVRPYAIHKTVKKALKYIVDPNKTKGHLLIDSMNCSTDHNLASVQFNTIQRMYAKDTYKNSVKKPIIAHHYVQSFKKGEIKDPELALKIAKETAQRHFGNDYQILFATHTNTDHIHTHMIVNSISLDGKKYHENGNSLKNIRSRSDEICKENNLSIIQNNYEGVSYRKWKPKTQNVFWKDKLKLSIDKAIIKSTDINEFIKEVAKHKCDAKLMVSAKGEQYLGIKESKSKWHTNTNNLGNDYSLDVIKQRIANKENELPIVEYTSSIFATSKVIEHNKEHKKVYQNNNTDPNIYIGIPLKYVSTIKLISKLIDRGSLKKSVKYYPNKPYSKGNDYNLKLLADQLTYISKNNITKEEDLNQKFYSIKESLDSSKNEINKLIKMESNMKIIIESIEKNNSLRNKSNLTQTEKAVLRSTEKVIEKYNVNVSNYESIIQKSNKLNATINELKPKLEALGKEFEIINSTNNTYKRLKDGSYIKEIESTKVKGEKHKNIEYEK